VSDNITYILFSSIIQGLTEFLPISSSGHLIILKDIFNVNIKNLDFEIILHLGTVFSVITYYKRYIFDMISQSKNNNSINIFLIITGCIPISIIGLFSKDFIELYFNDISLLPYSFMITAIFLFLTKYVNGKNQLTLKIVLIVGLFQVLALLPGISRSGITISSLLLLGINQKDAIKFSFLMAIPLIIGASLLTVNLVEISYLHLFGIIISFIFGWIAIYLTENLLQNKKYWMFSFYCFIISILTFIWSVS
tara:strand:- start:370 stop:1122 length:753 start_codon:yes stop_codon:yes gene_type:complete